MTTDEKRKFLEEFCDGECCHERCCPLFHTKCDWDICTDIELDVLYKIATEDGKEQKEQKEPTKATEHDPVNHPSHYTNGGMECIDEMILIFGETTVANFCICNVWKYRKRALYKNGEEDLKKADWYMAKYKELIEHGRN